MKRIRVIPNLLLAQSGLVKTKAFTKPQYLGDPINAVKIFNEKQADELVLLDIEATARGDILFDWVEDIVSEAFMPIAYGGGIRSIEQAAKLFHCGIEKIIINTSTCRTPELITQISQRFGTQSVVAAIDVRCRLRMTYQSYTCGGRKRTKLKPVQLAQNCEALGAGEIMLTRIEKEGSYEGYDLKLIEEVARHVRLPIIANGGAGGLEDFLLAVGAGASAVSAGSMFVFAGEKQGVLINYPTQSELQQQFWSHL